MSADSSHTRPLGADGTIWIDVEDFFHYFSWNPRPSGIQRLSFELMDAWHSAEGARVKFVRHGAGLLHEVPWPDVATAYRGRPATEANARFVGASRFRRSRIVRAINMLPDALKTPFRQAALQQRQAVRNWRIMARAMRRRRQRPVTTTNAAPITPLPGDVLLVLGAPWEIPGHASLLAECKRRFGLRAFLLIYDLIPVRHPEWCTEAAVRQFETWLSGSLPVFDGLFAISHHTAADVVAYAAERGLTLPSAIDVIPIGTSLGLAPSDAPPPPGLPTPGSYVLIVSTLEARKNHALAFRVWRKLHEDVRLGRRAAEDVPDLVFAGRVGWMVNDLLQQLENTGWLQGRVRLISDPSDAELRALYAGCRFTLFPSWFEGLGLPVTESFMFGKPCLASNATAIPEAGGDLCRYFAPGDNRGAYEAVAALLDDPAALPAWEAQVRREFRPVTWTDAVRIMRDRIASDRIGT